jgi:hypothetical protein
LVVLGQYRQQVLEPLVDRILERGEAVAVLVAQAAPAVPVLSSSVLHALTHLLLVRLHLVAQRLALTPLVVLTMPITHSIRLAR